MYSLVLKRINCICKITYSIKQFILGILKKVWKITDKGIGPLSLGDRQTLFNLFQHGVSIFAIITDSAHGRQKAGMVQIVHTNTNRMSIN